MPPLGSGRAAGSGASRKVARMVTTTAMGTAAEHSPNRASILASRRSIPAILPRPLGPRPPRHPLRGGREPPWGGRPPHRGRGPPPRGRPGPPGGGGGGRGVGGPGGSLPGAVPAAVDQRVLPPQRGRLHLAVG